MTDKINVNLGERSYPIYISSNSLKQVGEALKNNNLKGRILIVTNPKLNKLYGAAVLESFLLSGYNAEIMEIPDGEIYKNLNTVSKIYDYLIKNKYDRQTILAALGGGVVGDITGFAAATFMRGIRFIQIPTSLVAMVDSSVGGKTGVNHKLGKNLIGSFHQPSLVYIDTALLQTLEKSEFIGGMAEVIKYGIIQDDDFFEYLLENQKKIMSLSEPEINHIVKTSCAIKAEIVAKDEKEGGIRAILNFGHTVGHAIETLTDYTKYKHGEGVAIGMMAASRIANEMDLFSSMGTQKIWELIKKFKLPFKVPAGLAPEDICEKLKNDKKSLNGKARFVLPLKIGKVEIRNDVTNEIIIKSLKGMR